MAHTLPVRTRQHGIRPAVDPMYVLHGPEEQLDRKQSVEEDDELLIGEPARSETWPGPDVISIAAMKGRGIPDLGRGPGYSPALTAEHSLVTDLGLRGRDIAAETDTAQVDSVSKSIFISQNTKLSDRLVTALQKIPGHSEKHGYYPEKTFNSLINEECVKRELEQCFRGVLAPARLHLYTGMICGRDDSKAAKYLLSFKKIFAILRLSGKLSSILLFIDEGVADQHLPLEKVVPPLAHPNMYQLVRKGDAGAVYRPLACFQDWDQLELMRFEEWQWTTLPPFFYKTKRTRVGHFVLPDQVPLPFTSDSRYDKTGGEKYEVESGFSRVFKVDIHPEQHGFHGPKFSCRYFAVKCLHSPSRERFDSEVNVLRKFNDATHPHLTSLLATYEQFNKFYLIFPHAEANLEEYWRDRNPQPEMRISTIRWMADQCRGLANGLTQIHRWNSPPHSGHERRPRSLTVPEATSHGSELIGHHGDIKPQNLLWFQNPDGGPDEGVLKITDFGQTEFKAGRTTFNKSGRLAPVSPSFRPPEYDIKGGNGRSHDIWALGCVYLDFIAWILGGWELIQEFTSARQSRDSGWHNMETDVYFDITNEAQRKVATIKPAVTRFIAKFHDHPNCTEYLHQFLNLIQFDMLHVIPHDPILKESRVDVHDLNPKLAELCRKCQDEEYALTPASWAKDPSKTLLKSYADAARS
ncbi:hypothetical protein KVR01_012280 [Diaporthe batatas]|uniref:uncharacterized protein n=1 Tax=Diaporthe batatas TaxID=748121 RepID=UPI001D03AAEB|nr:uncharacterized protein KVR01_012280 [Diaporthe batatas]KAG8158008.1 hypothetical protein KVR01_012280 [Diaporthe batatas]